jgi:hypothetical protein
MSNSQMSNSRQITKCQPTNVKFTSHQIHKYQSTNVKFTNEISKPFNVNDSNMLFTPNFFNEYIVYHLRNPRK